MEKIHAYCLVISGSNPGLGIKNKTFFYYYGVLERVSQRGVTVVMLPKLKITFVPRYL